MNFFYIMKKIKILFHSQFMFEYTVFVNKYSRKFINVYLEKLIKSMVFLIYCSNEKFFCKTCIHH